MISVSSENNPQKSPKISHFSFIKKIRNDPWLKGGIIVLIILCALLGIIYWMDWQSKVYIEDATITAPVISICPESPGIIDTIYVSEGDLVSRNQRLAKVGNEILHAKTSGIITDVSDAPGKMVTTQTPVISMINREKLRAVGELQEDKGLKDIIPGQKADFTVDAFPSSIYHGLVEKVAQTAHEGDIVFSISDKRQEQNFDVTVLFDVDSYPELKNGMSAKIWVFK